ncbi:hypothetical protein GCM10020218_045260 [Dactylosporangium vinaceum]
MQRDRIEAGLLPIGFVQGGLLVLGLEYGTVSYLDDDDPADQQGYGPDAITRNLLQCWEPSFAAFWSALRAVPASLAGDRRAARRRGMGPHPAPSAAGPQPAGGPARLTGATITAAPVRTLGCTCGDGPRPAASARRRRCAVREGPRVAGRDDRPPAHRAPVTRCGRGPAGRVPGRLRRRPRRACC